MFVFSSCHEFMAIYQNLVVTNTSYEKKCQKMTIHHDPYEQTYDTNKMKQRVYSIKYPE